MFKRKLDVESGEIKYTLKSNDDSQIVEAHHTNIHKSQLIKWSISINPQNYKEMIKIGKNPEQVDWLEVHSILEQIFTKSYSANFMDDIDQSSLKIECFDENVRQFLGSFVIELPQTKVTSIKENFNKLEELLRDEKEGPLNLIADKIMSRIHKLSQIFLENREKIIQLEKENESLKKENELLKENSKKDKEESLEQEEFIIIEERSDNDQNFKEEEVQNKMVEIMQKQLEKLDFISQQIGYNQIILEKGLKIKKKSRDEKLIHRESKYNRIRGMGNSFLPNKELFFLKKFLKEAGLLENDKTVLNCVYTASKHGYSASDFHNCCDFKPRNLVLIKANDFFFGGYTPCYWGSKSGWVDNKETFIFSLSNPHNMPIKMNCKNSQKSIYDYTSFSCIFGGGSDIYISDNCNQNTNSYSDLGYTFEGCPFSFSTKEAKSFLCGSNNFKVQDIEVYQIIN